MTAGDIAKERFEQYMTGKLQDAWDRERWELYTYLLKQAENHRLDISGYISPEYKNDEREAWRQSP
jgi:hypothetical protein